MATLCQTGWEAICQHTETWIHSLDNFTDFLMFSKTTSPNSDSTGALLSGSFVCFICHTKQDLSLSDLFVYWSLISWGKTTQTRPGGREEHILQKILFGTPLAFSSPKIGHKQEKKDHLTFRKQCSQQQLSEVEHWRLIQTCWHEELRGNALVASKVPFKS